MIPYDDNVLINTELLSIIQMNEDISRHFLTVKLKAELLP